MKQLDHPEIFRLFSGAQDDDGVLYIGSTRVLAYDGDRWETIQAVQSTALRGLKIGRDGRLWVGAVNNPGWLTRDGSRQWTFHSLVPALPEGHRDVGDVWRIEETDTGVVFSTTSAIFHGTPSRLRVIDLPGARRPRLFKRDGRVYVQQASIGLCELDDGNLKNVVPASNLDGAMVEWFDPTPRGIRLVTTNGIVEWDGKTLSEVAPKTSEFIRNNLISCVLSLADGRLAIGTVKGGIAVASSEDRFWRVSTEEGLPAQYVAGLMQEKQGALWSFGDSGAARVPLVGATRLYDRQAGLPEVPFKYVTTMGNRLFVAHDDGVLELNRMTGRFEENRAISGSAINVLQATQDELWVGRFGAIDRLSESGTARIYSELNSISAMQPGVGVENELLIGGQSGVFRLTGRGNNVPIITGLSAAPSSIAEDSSGRVWLGTQQHGVLIAEQVSAGGTFHVVNAERFGVPQTEHGSIVRRTRSGGLLILIDSVGGWFLPPGSEKVESIKGFPKRSTQSVSRVTSDDTMWLMHADALGTFISRIVVENGHARWEARDIEGLDRVGVPRDLAIEETASGPIVWLAGSKGVLRAEGVADAVPQKPMRPLLRMAVQRAEGKDFEAINGPLPYNVRSVRLTLAVPDFARRASLRIETRVEGIDPDWTPLDASSQRELGAIRDGRYVVLARTVAANGLVSDPVLAQFLVKPPWWRAPVGLALYVVVVLAGTLLIYLWRVRALRRRTAELEVLVAQRTEQLERANEAKTEFVANMSHDIRNPLNGIVGLAIALEDTPLDEHQAKLVTMLRDCTGSLSTLVDEVLDFASVEAGKIELRREPYAPADVLRGVSGAFGAEQTRSGVRLEIDLDPALPPRLIGDSRRIRQILSNFVSNAVKYAGGEITLYARMQPEQPEEMEFGVIDRGAGIAPEELRTLFTKFTRLEQAKQGTEKGTGLGLASCRLLADHLGGEVGASSVVGQGSTFFLRLPLIAAEAEIASHIDGPAPALPPVRVLLVEDADYNAWAATAVLAKLGLTAERAATGEQALELMADRSFDVVLLDRHLPGIDGLEVARRIRAMENTGSTPVLLAVTAYCTTEDRQMCLDAGMDGFVGKPLTPERLRSAIIDCGSRLKGASSVEAAPPPPKVFPDLTMLRYISDGTSEGLNQQIELYLTMLAQLETKLADGVRDEDYTQARGAAHQLRSHALMVHAQSLENVAGQLERGVAEGDPERIRVLHARLTLVAAEVAGRLEMARQLPS